MLKKVPEMKTNYSFDKIDLGPDLVKLPDEIIETMSTDQVLSYKKTQAVRSGLLPRDVALRKIRDRLVSQSLAHHR